MIIYQLTSPENKHWIGQSKTTLPKRFQQHLTLWKKLHKRGKNYRGSCTKLFLAFDKFDPSLWIKNVIYEPTTQEEMDQKEIHYIELYDCVKNGYNICKGGQGIKKGKLDEEHKQNISKARIEWFKTQEGIEWKEELSQRYSGNNNPMFGKTLTNEQKQIISNANKGKETSIELRELRRKNATGRIMSEQSKEKNRKKAIQRHKNGKYDYEKIGKQRAALGLHQPQSQKDKVAKALQKEWLITNPQGKIIKIFNLQKFCRDNNLDQGNMMAVAAGRLKHSKQWKCQKI